ARLPLASSRTSALAHKSCTFPSAGLVRDAYPDIHMGCLGVITTLATPTCQVAPSCAASGAAQTRHSNVHALKRLGNIQDRLPYLLRNAHVLRLLNPTISKASRCFACLFPAPCRFLPDPRKPECLRPSPLHGRCAPIGGPDR